MHMQPRCFSDHLGLNEGYALVLALLAALSLVGCDQPASDAPPASAAHAAPAVETITVQPEPVTITESLSGRTTPYLIAEVRPQVGGIIQARQFQEGALVEAGDVLYRIDARLYEADFASAKAALAQAQATLELTRLTAERYEDLLGSKSVSQQEHDDADAAYRQAQAAVAVAEAALQRARINLDYTQVTAPISGRIGRSSVTAGALVTTNQSEALAVVQQLDPIYVDLSQSSASLLRARKRFMHDLPPDDIGVDVHLTLEDGTAYDPIGRLELAEVTVSQDTGSVALRAVFPNPDGILLPGMFVRATIDLGRLDEAVMVPAQALSRDNQGNPQVMVLGDDDRVVQRPLGQVELIGKRWLVHDGLRLGERVIVSGLQHIRPGMVVRAQGEPAPQPIGPATAALVGE